MLNMKKIILLLTMTITLAFFNIINAQVIQVEEAQEIAQKAYAEISNVSAKAVSFNDDFYVKNINEQPVTYIFNSIDGGFVIVSAEERTIPILAYSDNGNIATDESEWEENFAFWMQTYFDQIEYIRENDLPASVEAVEYRSKLDNGQDLGLRPAKDVAPLMSTTWNQGCGYNADCPADASGPCGHVYTGCVATAMAQVIRYMEYPIHGVGDECYTHYVYGEQCADYAAATYDYASMPNGSGNAEVAELMYHCGVSVDMNYSPTGSGSYSYKVPRALNDHFDYKNAVILSKNSYDPTVWCSILINEIDNSRPMYYSGSGSGGHAFVVDGYQGTDYFHFNWGWGGSYNGHFYLDDLTPGSADYTNSQQAVIGAIPSTLFTNLDFSGALELSCATAVSQDLSTGNDYINYYSYTYPACPGKELTYYFTTTLPGRIRIKTTNISDGDLRIFLLSHPHQDSLITYATNDLIIDDTDAGTYYISIESVSALEPTFDIEVICPTIDAELIFTNGQVNPQYLTDLQTNVIASSNIKNIGNTTAAANTINYYLSTDNVYDFGVDTYLGNDVIPELTPGSSTNIITNLTMPAGLIPGPAYIVFVADESNIVPEADDQNEFFAWAEVPNPGLLDCSSSVSLTDGVWYYDNTELNGVNNVEAHWAAWEQTAPEIVHSFISPYDGMATISFTEKVAGEMHCMVYPICNENTWLASTWFAELTDTLATETFYVTAGTEYFVVVDSKLPIQGEYGVKIDLPEECPNIDVNVWGELELCDGDFYPNFDAQWGYSNYQWYKDGLALEGETWNGYTPSQPGDYYVMISENGCDASSDTFTVSMSFPPDTATIVSLGPIEFCDGGSVDLQLDNVISYPYQWAKDGELIAGETSGTLTVTESGNYSLFTTNASCSVESDTIIEVHVNNNPTDIYEQTPLPTDSIDFYFTFNEDNNDIINNYSFSCWDFVPADDRDGNFWQARDFSTGDYFGYASHYAEIPDEFTISLWFNTTTTEGGMMASFLDSPWGGASQDAVLYMSDDGKLHFYMSNGGTPEELVSTNAYNDGNWHNVLIVHGFGILMEIDETVEHLSVATEVTHQTFDGYWTFAGEYLPADVLDMPTSLFYDGMLDDIMVIREAKYGIRNYLDADPELNVEITSGIDTYCDNTLAYFTIENAENEIEYQLWNNTTSAFYPIAETGNGNDLVIGGELITETTEFMFLATDPVTLCETWLDTTITITVHPLVAPTISIVSDGIDPICQGTTITFDATIGDAGASPTIEWYYNDIPQGVNADSFSYSGFTDTDTVYAVVWSDYICPDPDSVISNEIAHTVLPNTTPSVSIVNTPVGVACAGETITFVATPTDCGASPSYQWYRDGAEVGTDSDTYATDDFDDGEEIYVIVTSDYACSTSPTAESNHITTDVSTPPEANYTILSGGYCTSEEVCFEYSGETTGLDHVEWEVTDGGPATNFSGEGPHCYTPGGSYLQIGVTAYDANGCTDTALFVNPLLSPSITPSVTISTDELATYCHYYDDVIFTAAAVNSGAYPVYQWYVNGNPEGTNSDTFVTATLEDNDEIYCIVTNTVSCATSPTAESNHININIEPVPNASMVTTGGTCMSNEICFHYDGSMTDISSVDWVVRENSVETLSYTGVGPHCFDPVHNDVEIVVTVTGTNGCFDTIPSYITVNDTPGLTIPDTVYKCMDSWTSVTEATGYADYAWSNGDEDNYMTTPDEGLYYLTVTNSFGCESVDSVAVINYPDEDIVLPTDTTICLDETIILDIENSYVYDNIYWTDGVGTVWNEENPEIGYMGNNPQFIYVETESEHCTFSDTIYIHFDVCEGIDSDSTNEISIYPNPAPDYVIIESDTQIDNIVIYDITGKIVFETIPTESTFRINVKNWPDAAYYIQIITKQGEVIKSGFIKI